MVEYSVLWIYLTFLSEQDGLLRSKWHGQFEEVGKIYKDLWNTSIIKTSQREAAVIARAAWKHCKQQYFKLQCSSNFVSEVAGLLP